MHAMIVYDSLYGNTEKIAQAIGDGFSATIKVLPVTRVKASDLEGLDVLLIGTPTQGGRPTAAIQQLLDSLPRNSLKNVNVTAFDTRFAKNDHGFGLKMLMQTIGFAAEKTAGILKSKGGNLITDPEWFIVAGKEGPLKNGELERAEEWGKKLQKYIKNI